MHKIENVAILGGCGHVGLPLGIVLAELGGFQVTLIDIDARKVEAVNRGRMPFMEAGAEDLLKKVIHSRLHATLDTSDLRTAEAVITVIGTPLDDHLNPTIHQLLASIEEALNEMGEGSLLILRSTVYPGVTKLIYDRIQAKKRNIHLAFCPERIAEGRAIEELTKLPQIISAFEPEGMTKARELFGRIAKEIIELAPLEAELAKLFTNSWRYLNFAISNQFYMLAQSNGVDFHKIHEAVTRDYPRMSAFRRAGFAAGPCLLKDTLQLAAFSGNNFFLGHAAMLINEGLPNFLVNQIRNMGRSARRVAILGMAFKADSDDPRESLSYKLKKLLEANAFEVVCSDPYVPGPGLVGVADALARADIVILGVPHSAYKNLQIPPGKIVVDIWNFWPQHENQPIKWAQAGVSVGAQPI